MIPTKKTKHGFQLPLLGLGTWKLGGTFSKDQNSNKEKDINSVQLAIDKGLTHIDTAEMYAGGYTEWIVSKGIEPFKREKLFIASKAWSKNLKYHDLISAAKKSIKRLGIRYLDLYYIHSPNPEISIKETMKAMDFLVDEGLVRHVGLSNFSPKSIEQAQAFSRHKISAAQAHYNLIVREPHIKGLKEYCVKNDILLVAWRPLECGELCNNSNPFMSVFCERLNKTAAQIAINWLTSQKNVVTISTMRNKKHLDENLKALGWNLNQMNSDVLKNDFPNQLTISNTVPLS